MPLGKFIVYSTAGAFPWSMLLVFAGTVLGANWVDIRHALQPFDLAIARRRSSLAVVLFVWWRLGHAGPARAGRQGVLTRPRAARAAGSSRRPDGSELAVQQQVVDDLEAAREEERERRAARRSTISDARERRRDRRPGRPGDPGHAGRRRALVRIDDRHDVGLARRDVHLAEAEAQQEHGDRQRQRRHQRDEDQQHVRRQVGEDHRVDQADPGGDPGRRQRRHRRQQVRAEEDRRRGRPARPRTAGGTSRPSGSAG